MKDGALTTTEPGDEVLGAPRVSVRADEAGRRLAAGQAQRAKKAARE